MLSSAAGLSPSGGGLLGLLGLGSRLGGMGVGLGNAGGDFLGARQRGDLVDRGFLDQAGRSLLMGDHRGQLLETGGIGDGVGARRS